MSITNIITLIGGLGMFLFGMNSMGDGLEKAAGERMQKIIEMLTGNLIKGVLVGTVVTGLIQSSSATTVMVIGFINAGVMTLGQAVGVIMGANIGTTVTAQILRLADIEGGAWYLALLKPDTLAPIAIAIGVYLIMFTKKKRTKDIGEILAGFGILFIGMDIMEGAVSGIKDLPQIRTIFATLGENPFLGVLAGTAVTALIQSSSASIGILQAVAATGLLPFSSALPIILGQNIGTCITAILSSIGATKNAKKASVVHLSFNVIGTIIFLIAMYGIQYAWGFPFWSEPADRGIIANFHTTFNLINTLLLLPFSGLLVKIADFIIRADDKQIEQPSNLLDDRFLVTPPVAVAQSVKAVINMITLAYNNFTACTDLIFQKEKNIVSKLSLIDDNENAIDRMESDITAYLVKVSAHDLNDEENNMVSGIFHSITDIERIGDHTTNISDSIKYMNDEGIRFSDSAMAELRNMTDAVGEVIRLCIKAYEEDDIQAAKDVQPCEAVVDILKQELREKHINRLTRQECEFNTGISFLDIVNNLERISDHCSNIAMSVEQHLSTAKLDPHQYPKHMGNTASEEYLESFERYKAKYGI